MPHVRVPVSLRHVIDVWIRRTVSSHAEDQAFGTPTDPGRQPIRFCFTPSPVRPASLCSSCELKGFCSSRGPTTCHPARPLERQHVLCRRPGVRARWSRSCEVALCSSIGGAKDGGRRSLGRLLGL